MDADEIRTAWARSYRGEVVEVRTGCEWLLQNETMAHNRRFVTGGGAIAVKLPDADTIVFNAQVKEFQWIRERFSP